MARLGVTVAVLDGGQVLLTRRQDFPVWCLPGGGIDPGESAAAAAVREVREETGLEVALTRLVGVYSRPHWSPEGSHEVLYAARVVGGALVRETAETTDAAFVAPDALPEPLIWWHRGRVADAFASGAATSVLQDAPWIFGELSGPEVYVRRAAGQLDLGAIAAQLSALPHEGAERVELPRAYPAKRMAAGALFWDEGGRLLIVKPTYRLDWLIPGGVVERDESPRAACEREVLEELGISVPIVCLLCVEYQSIDNAGSESVQFIFAGGQLDDAAVVRIRLPPNELASYRFAPLDEALALLAPRLARRVPHALRAHAEGRIAYLEDGAPLGAGGPR
jgi:8-oxo-dGTP pyrophosphatase MutT (NUDIX family)